MLLDSQMQKGQIRNKTCIDCIGINCKLYIIGNIIKLTFQCNLQSKILSHLEDIMTNLLQLVQAWEFQPSFCLFNFIYLLYFKFVNVLGNSIISDGQVAIIMVG